MSDKPRHLLISFHTCPTEQPGQDLAGGMNVLLKGFLQNTDWPTEVVTRGFAKDDQSLALSPTVTLHRLSCGARRPWGRESALQCLPAFRARLEKWLSGKRFDVASAHYWMSATLLDLLDCPSGIIFHTLQAQKGPPSETLERLRLQQESRLLALYRCGFLHWHDLRNARFHYPNLRGTVVRPGCQLPVGNRREDTVPHRFGWAARPDAIKNVNRAFTELRSRQADCPGSTLLVAGSEGPPSEGVRFLGSLRPELMLDFYDQIDQLWNFSDYETFGLSVLEALSRGVSVGLSSHSDWARRLRRLNIDSNPGARWSESQRCQALRLAECYSWDRALPCWERWLRWLIRQPGPGGDPDLATPKKIRLT